MPGEYLYKVEYAVDDYELWIYPEDLQDQEPESLPTILRFRMQPSICLEITDEEYEDQVNCDTKNFKHVVFTLGYCEMKKDDPGELLACKLKCKGNEIEVGSYKICGLKQKFLELKEKFEVQKIKNELCGKTSPCDSQPCSDVIQEVAELKNEKCQSVGRINYTLNLTCYGLTINSETENRKEKAEKAEMVEKQCLEPTTPKANQSEYNEYAAEVNGNQLIVRIHKGKSYLVTRVFDENMDQKGNEINRDANFVSLLGCDQQIDFKFPENFSCGDTKQKSKCGCNSNANLTNFQQKTSCLGKSFKNSPCLPVIRGNLKYPGKFDDPINFDVYDKSNPLDATEKYSSKSQTTRAVCLQVDKDNLDREVEGKCKTPSGIEVCKKGCSDPNVDVFVLKLGQKNKDKNGHRSEIELEMRTPKAPDVEIKKKETREVQVEETDFENACKKKTSDGSKNTSKNAPKGFSKRK
ncbi:CLUMA_CG002694, isoform A [Clunio marinus]|uniref:CLUMA_CG002694, isoform A n=1 Tax=Clunio marinus TaxID=568069 RepID=A0A1J1HRJ5_9DIPT|nr:CLUMA_CG002694, isoform A [Clunio marinus]